MEKIEANLRAVCKGMKKDRDYTLAITGKKRRGKSTLAYWIAQYVSQVLKSKVWLCYSYKELRQAMENSKQYDVIFADEAISFLNKYLYFKVLLNASIMLLENLISFCAIIFLIGIAGCSKKESTCLLLFSGPPSHNSIVSITDSLSGFKNR